VGGLFRGLPSSHTTATANAMIAANNRSPSNSSLMSGLTPPLGRSFAYLRLNTRAAELLGEVVGVDHARAAPKERILGRCDAAGGRARSALRICLEPFSRHSDINKGGMYPRLCDGDHIA
jgi:hypothetical protein